MIKNVWCADVLGNAIKGGNESSVSRVIRGGGRHAKDKTKRHNSGWKVLIEELDADDFGKLSGAAMTFGLLAPATLRGVTFYVCEQK